MTSARPLKYSRAEAKSYARKAIEGVFTALHVPDNAAFEIAPEAVARSVRHCIDVVKSDGLFVNGILAHYWLLTNDERKRVVEVVVRETADRLPVMVNCSHQSLKDAIDLVRHAESAGADLVAVSGPHLGGQFPGTITPFIREICAATNLGVTIYIAPLMGYVIDPDELSRLAEIPNVVSLKVNGELGYIQALRARLDGLIPVVDPVEQRFLTHLASAGQRAVYTNANLLFDNARATPMHDYVHAALRGDEATAMQLFESLLPLRVVYQKWIMQPWRQTGIPFARIRYWAELNGMVGGAIRPPLPTMTPDEQAEMRADLASIGALP